MTADPLVLLPEVDRATARLLATIRKLDDAAVAAPSLLPGWTRGHVLSHVAGNAYGCVRLLTWARTGAEAPQYASAEARDAEIEAGAGRTAAEHVAEVTSSAEQIDEAVAQMPPDAWASGIRWLRGNTTPAAYVVWSRLREVEVHHADLDAGYDPADWPRAFVHRLLHELAANLAGGMAPVRLHAVDLDHELAIGTDPTMTVSGPGHAIARWLTGRGGETVLSVAPDGPLPTVPTWK
jgi:maleylpyruvate isomerase